MFTTTTSIFLYVLQSVIFLCVSLFFFLKRLEFLKRRKVDALLSISFLLMSFSYLVYSLTYALPDSGLIFFLDGLTDLILILYNSFFALILLGIAEVVPFTFVYQWYLKLITKWDKYIFRRKLIKSRER